MNLLTKIGNPVFRNSLIYMATDAFARAVGMLLLPIVSKYLIPEELGIAANFDVLQSILSLLAGMAMVNGLSYFYYQNTKEKNASLISSLAVLIVSANIFFSMVIFFASGLFERFLHIGLGLQLLTVVSTTALLLSDINKLIYRLDDEPLKFAALQLGQSILYIGLQLFLVVHLEMQAEGRIYSTVISLCFFAVIHVLLLMRKGYLRPRIDRTAVRELLNFGLPLLPHSLSFWLKSGMDKILLTTYCGLAVNGLYSMAMTFGAMYTMCEFSFSKAYSPYLQKRLSTLTLDNEKSEKRKLVNQAYGFGAIFVLLYFVLVGVCWFLINYIVDSKYLPCFEFIPWILMACTIHVFYSLTIEYIYTAKKTLGLGIITFSGSLAQFLMTFTFVNLWGQNGIKYSIVLGNLIIMVGVWWYSNRVYPMPWFRKMS